MQNYQSYKILVRFEPTTLDFCFLQSDGTQLSYIVLVTCKS